MRPVGGALLWIEARRRTGKGASWRSRLAGRPVRRRASIQSYGRRSAPRVRTLDERAADIEDVSPAILGFWRWEFLRVSREPIECESGLEIEDGLRRACSSERSAPARRRRLFVVRAPKEGGERDEGEDSEANTSRWIERWSRLTARDATEGVYQFSVQRDQVNNREELTRGMQGLAIRVAKAINKHWGGRHGTVFAERYFARALEKPMQVWRALRYVVNNARKHGEWFSDTQPDPFSSGRWLRCWENLPGLRRPTRSPPLARARHYLTISWRHFPLSLTDLPGTPTYASY